MIHFCPGEVADWITPPWPLPFPLTNPLFDALPEPSENPLPDSKADPSPDDPFIDPLFDPLRVPSEDPLPDSNPEPLLDPLLATGHVGEVGGVEVVEGSVIFAVVEVVAVVFEPSRMHFPALKPFLLVIFAFLPCSLTLIPSVLQPP